MTERKKHSPTGRFAKYPPNIQRIPLRTQEARDIRDAFTRPNIPIPDTVYETYELRVMAELWRNLWGRK